MMLGIHFFRRAANLVAAVVALLFLSVIGCSDGGVGGTGISTVQGNVRHVELDGQAALAGIVVREPASGAEDVTSDTGAFRVVGRFPTEMTLLFYPPSVGQPAAVGLTVPAGAEVTLENIRLEGQLASPERVYAVLPPGKIGDRPECTDNGGSFDLDLEGLLLTVLIDQSTVITGNRSCNSLSPGTLVKVRGLQEDHSITATEITVVKSGLPPRP